MELAPSFMFYVLGGLRVFTWGRTGFHLPWGLMTMDPFPNCYLRASYYI